MQWTTCLLGVRYGAWQKVNISSAFFEQGRWKRNKEWGSGHSAWLNTHTHQSARVYQNVFNIMWNGSQIAVVVAEHYNEATLDNNTRHISSEGTDALMTSVNNTSHYADMTGDMANLTLNGPCIVIYSYNESQRDAPFLKFIWQSTLHV